MLVPQDLRVCKVPVDSEDPRDPLAPREHRVLMGKQEAQESTVQSGLLVILVPKDPKEGREMTETRALQDSLLVN